MMHEPVISFDDIIIMLKWSTSNTPKSLQNDCCHSAILFLIVSIFIINMDDVCEWDSVNTWQDGKNSMLLEQDTWQANFWFQLMHNVGTCKGTRLWKSDTPMDLNQPPMPQNTMLECYVPMLQCDINNTSPKNAEIDARDYLDSSC